jgi:hypothetical protein
MGSKEANGRGKREIGEGKRERERGRESIRGSWEAHRIWHAATFCSAPIGEIITNWL